MLKIKALQLVIELDEKLLEFALGGFFSLPETDLVFIAAGVMKMLRHTNLSTWEWVVAAVFSVLKCS